MKTLLLCRIFANQFLPPRLETQTAPQITANLWTHILETAHAEFTWSVSRMSDNQFRYFGKQACKIFALGILHFKTLRSGDPGDWMDFLMEENAAQIIQEIDRKVVSMIESFCNDVKATMEILPYYSRYDILCYPMHLVCFRASIVNNKAPLTCFPLNLVLTIQYRRRHRKSCGRGAAKIGVEAGRGSYRRRREIRSIFKSKDYCSHR